MDLDDLDRQIVSYFHEHPRATNRALSRALGIAEATVASRIRKLIAGKVLKFTIQRDLRAMGFAYQATVGVYVSGRSAADVASDLAKVPAIQMVALLQSAPEVLATVIAQTRTDLLRVMSDDIETIPGIRSLQLDFILDVRKYDTKFGMVRTN